MEEERYLQSLVSTIKYRKTKKGFITNLFHQMRSRREVCFDLNFFRSFSNCTKFNRLFDEWEKSDYKKQLKPTIDRINRKDPYKADNIQWLTWAENRYKQSMEMRNRSLPVAQIFDEKVIKTYRSQREAVKETGLSQSNMSSVLNGKREFCGGYKWKYIEK